MGEEPYESEGKHSRKSYAESLKSYSNNRDDSFTLTLKPKTPRKLPVMLHNLPPQAKIKEIWMFLNKKRIIRDIVLPKKYDKNNFRIGFVMDLGRDLAESLIPDFNQRISMGHKLSLKLVHNSSSLAKPSKLTMGSRDFKQSTNQPISQSMSFYRIRINPSHLLNPHSEPSKPTQRNQTLSK